jgi:hypothetical protein
MWNPFGSTAFGGADASGFVAEGDGDADGDDVAPEIAGVGLSWAPWWVPPPHAVRVAARVRVSAAADAVVVRITLGTPPVSAVAGRCPAGPIHPVSL